MTNQLFTSKDIAKGYFESQFDTGKTFDLCVKDITIKNLPTLIVYVSGLVNGESLAEMLANTQWDQEEEIDDEPDYFHYHFNYHGKEDATSIDAFMLGVLSGNVGFVTESGYCYLAEFRNYPGRSPEEPDNEKVIRGSRDGFSENIITNTALIRRRIRSEKLRFEMHHVSTYGQTDVVLSYMSDLVNESHLKWLIERLEQIQHDGLTMSDKSLEEWLFKQKFHPLPFVRYTERPDIVAAHVLEGHIAIMVDTSPSVMLIPVTMFHLLQHAEEYRQAPLVGTMMRFLRFGAVILSFLLLPFWYLLVTHPDLLPDSLAFIGINEKGQIPIFLQILFADIGIEYLRIAAIHTPTPLSTAMGLIAGIIIGQIAIDVGLFSSEVVLYTAVTAIFTFAIPNYELSISVKVFRLALLAATALFGVTGFFIGIFIIFTYLCSLKPMKVPYLWPLVPFFPKAFARVIIRTPMSQDALRPFVVGAKQRKRV
ncbi:spore germination protein [Solibacillus sp. A46]|uniref:Spore germination protein n=1 Tax=Solibacillus faecavium TaxID=2762221 RepID=A0ABR8XTG8_9BACL|nr:spore germination protein [Solibacillus faecavium]MBD8035238.1 spore germination protein [Solibacillus faecavium]